MDERTLTLEQIIAYGGYLRTEERAPGTIEKYLRDARSFAVWLDGAPVTKENATGWKEQLRAQGSVSYTHLDVYKRQVLSRKKSSVTIHRFPKCRAISSMSITNAALGGI